MSYEPCQNPNCNSFGKSHPNCRCHGSFAGGGQVKHFCSSENSHDPKCEYYADGGAVDSMAIDDGGHSVLGNLLHGGFQHIRKLQRQASFEKYHLHSSKGHKKLSMKFHGLFNNSKIDHEDSSKDEDEIDQYISNGGLDKDLDNERFSGQHNYAEGGEVKHESGVHLNHPIEVMQPAQAMHLGLVKGRVSNYLNALKPKAHQPKLLFDHEPDHTQQSKEYKRALKIAANPSYIVKEIEKGKLEPEHLKHLNSMYPEVGAELQKKAVEKIIESKMDGKKVPYKIRQSLSLLLGVPLNSEMTPQRIMAAQATFQSGAVQPLPQTAAGGKTASLSKTAQSYLTADEAAASRQQKQ